MGSHGGHHAARCCATRGDRRRSDGHAPRMGQPPVGDAASGAGRIATWRRNCGCIWSSPPRTRGAAATRPRRAARAARSGRRRRSGHGGAARSARPAVARGSGARPALRLPHARAGTRASPSSRSLSLAIGIGANTAVFSFADTLLLRPLAGAAPGRGADRGFDRPPSATSLVASYREYVDIRDRSKSFDGLVAFTKSHGAAFATEPERLAETEHRHAGERQLLPGDGRRAAAGTRLPARRRPGARTRRGRHSRPRFLGAASSAPTAPSSAARCGSTGSSSRSIGVAPAGFTGLDQYVRFQFYAPLMMWPRLSRDPDGPTVRGARCPESQHQGTPQAGRDDGAGADRAGRHRHGSGTRLPGHEPESTHRRRAPSCRTGSRKRRRSPTLLAMLSHARRAPCCSSRAPTSRDC